MDIRFVDFNWLGMVCYRLILALLLIVLSGHSIGESLLSPGPVVTKYRRFANITLGSINRIVEDKQHFMWLGTDDGLFRFDGYQLDAFELPAKGAKITDMVADDEDRLWIATGKHGLFKLDLKTAEFRQFNKVVADISTIDSDNITRLALTPNGQLVIATAGGLNLFDRTTLVNRRLALFGGNTPPQMTNVLIDSLGHFWLTSLDNGVYRYDLNNQQLTNYRHTPAQDNSLSNNSVRAIYETAEGTVWVGTDHGLNRFDRNKSTFERFYHPKNAIAHQSPDFITQLFEDNEQRLWVITDNDGLFLFDRSTLSFGHISTSSNFTSTFNARVILDIMQDSSGALWASALGQGLIRLNPQALNFTFFTDNTLAGIQITALLQSREGHLWFAGNNHLWRFDHQNETADIVHRNVGYVSAMVQGEDSSILLTLNEQGLQSVDPNTGRLTEFSSISNTLPRGRLHALTIDNDQNLWLGVFDEDSKNAGGLFFYDRQQGLWQQLLADRTVEDILSLDNNLLLVATRHNGLQLLDRATQQWLAVQSKQGLAGNAVRCLKQDSKGRIWVGTIGAGLAQFDPSNKSLVLVSELSDLPSQNIHSLVEDLSGRLWLGTDNNLVMYQPDSGQYRVFDSNNVLQETEFTARAAVLAADGQVSLAGAAGLTRFYPENLVVAYPKATAAIAEFKLFDKKAKTLQQPQASALRKSISYRDKIILDHQDYLFSFHLVTSDHNNLDNAKFAYRMEGLDQQWLHTDSFNRVATYTDLPAGEYQFQYKLLSDTGDTPFQSLNVSILPPFWLSEIAFTLFVVMDLILLFIGYHMRVRSLNRKADKLVKAVNLKTVDLNHKNHTISTLLEQKKQFLAQISHELRTPLTLLISPLDGLLDNNKNSQTTTVLTMMKRNGSRLHRLVDQLLSLARLESHIALPIQQYSLANMIEQLGLSFQPLLEGRSQTLEISPFDDVLLALTEDSLEQILINLLSNAIKYTPEQGKITIIITSNQHWVTIEVADSGIGIRPEEQTRIFDRFTRADDPRVNNESGAGIGLALVKELVLANKGSIHLISEPNKGSRFTVKLPIDVVTGEPLKAIDLSEQLQLQQTEYLNTTVQLGELQDKVTAQNTLLIVEDNLDMQVFIVSLFADDYRCVVAEDGQVGLDTAIEQIPDLIISDVMMPRMDGFELTGQLKQHPLCCHIPVILLTAKGDMESRLKGWQHYADEFLPKPFNSAELKIRVKNLLAIRDILKQRFGRNLMLAPTEPDPKVPVQEQRFITKFEQLVCKHFHDPQFDRTRAASDLAMSERQLNRKLSAVFDHNFSEYLRKYRLGQAVNLLGKENQVAQIGDMVGFASTAYFCACFKAEFGKTVKQYEHDKFAKV